MADKEKMVAGDQPITLTRDELRALIAEEVAAAKAAAAPERVMVREQQLIKKPAAKEKMVKITPRSDDNRDTDVIVGSVNGVPFKVICDEENEVPESVAAVIAYSQEQDRKIKKAMKKKQDEWQKMEEKL
jgi:hypothetical protein